MRGQYIAVVVASSLLLASGAARADGTEPRATTPVSQQTADWTGLYANAGIGYGFWSAQTTTDAPAGCVSCATTDFAGRGWLGEVGLGYDYQVSHRVVAGLLVNYAIADMRGNVGDSVFTTAKTSNESTWFVGLRAGWLMTPDVLNYWSVGYTHTHFSGARLRNSFTGAPLPGARLAGYDAGGWFLGTGLEVAMHRGWYWRGEVRYADYGNEARTETGITPVFNLNFDPVVGTATTGLVYRFDWDR
jgi:outer membrane immunogenic protein